MGLLNMDRLQSTVATDVLQTAWAKQAKPSLFFSTQLFMRVRAMLPDVERGKELAFATHPCPSSKMSLTTKVRVSNGSGGSVSGDPQIEICGMQQGVTLRPSRGSSLCLLTKFVPLLKC